MVGRLWSMMTSSWALRRMRVHLEDGRAQLSSDSRYEAGLDATRQAVADGVKALRP